MPHALLGAVAAYQTWRSLEMCQRDKLGTPQLYIWCASMILKALQQTYLHVNGGCIRNGHVLLFLKCTKISRLANLSVERKQEYVFHLVA